MASSSLRLSDCTCASYFALVFSLVLTLLATTVHNQNLSLEFSEDFSLYADSLVCLGACDIGSSQVTLPTSGGSDIGRLLYAFPVRFFNASAGVFASFRTSFVFTISGASSDAPIADGLVFLITPRVSIPPRSGGGALGLFEPRYDAPFAGEPVDGSTNVVAVEIDTYSGNPNVWDPGYAPHVGLDLDSLNSAAVSNVLPEITVGSTVGVWIYYSAVTQELEVSMHVVRSPSTPNEANAHSVLHFSGFNLSSYVKEESYIGFSATQGLYVQANSISYWSFELIWPGAAAEAPFPASKTLPVSSPRTDHPYSQPDTESTNPKSRVLLVVGVPFAIVTLALGLCFCLAWRWRNRARPRWPLSSIPALEMSEEPQLPPDGPRQFAYNVLKKATDGFSTILGEGSFGGVYKGVLPDGSQVAVKRIKERLTLDGDKQFVAEATSIGQLSHRNLVPLRGWCHEHHELLLVYEYMPNGSVDSNLHPKDTSSAGGSPLNLSLDWEKRVKIIRGVADALNYLHQGWEQPLIHRDVKPSNVLLDAHFTARLGDFGLAVAMSEDKISQTVIQAAGTIGYLAPECQQSFKVGADSDVFSFGVTVLELLSGRKPIDWSRPQNEFHLVSWIWALYIRGSLMEAVDPHIRAECDNGEATMLLQLGLMCSFPDPTSRPTMRVVSQFLTASVPLPHLPKEVPAFCDAPTTPLGRKYVALMKAFNSSSSITSTSSTLIQSDELSRRCSSLSSNSSELWTAHQV